LQCRDILFVRALLQIGTPLHQCAETLRLVHQKAVLDHMKIIVFKRRAGCALRNKFQIAVYRFVVVDDVTIRIFLREEPALVFSDGLCKLRSANATSAMPASSSLARSCQ
jgi:hypothetical protein